MSLRAKRSMSELSAAPSSETTPNELDPSTTTTGRCGKCSGCLRKRDCGNCVACMNNRVAKKKTVELQIVLRQCLIKKCRRPSRPSSTLSEENSSQSTAPPPSTEATVSSESSKERLKREAAAAGVPPENLENWRVLNNFNPLANLMLQDKGATSTLNDTLAPTIRDPYGLVIPNPPVENICSSCMLRTDGDNDDNDPILLCDGCDREYHLRCLQPRYAFVPAGDFYCWDCSSTGTTASLQAYLDGVDQARANHSTRAAYIASLRDKMVSTFHKHMAGRKPTKFSKQEYQIPSSELDLEHIQRIEHAIYSSETAATTSAPQPESVADTHATPDFLISKPIDLFYNDAAEGDRLHSGRIVDRRESKDDGSIEYLVRFPAGADFRKTHLAAWISLEEHVITVETTLVWIEEKKAQWIPAIVQLRSVLSLIMLQRTQAIPEPDSPPRHSYRTTSAKRERVNAWTKTFGDRPGLIERDMKSQATPFVPKESGRLAQLAAVEWHEQQRVRQWWSMKLVNPYGYRALTSRDEYELEPLIPARVEKTNGLQSHAELCPLVPRGLDRLHIVQLMRGGGPVDPVTRDVASTLTCKVVSISSSLVLK